MQEAFEHCQRLVREHDKDRFLATLFAPQDHRPGLFALYAFDIEIARVPLIVRQPMAGEVRLQWWREILAGDRGEEARATPIASALCETLQNRRELIGPLDALLEARRADLYDEPLKTISDLEDYAKMVSAPVMDVALRLLCGNSGNDAQEFVFHASEALLLERVLRGVEGTVARRMLSEQVDVTKAELRERVVFHLEHARALLPLMPSEAWPAFLPLALIPLRLAKLATSDSILDEQKVDVPQWRRQWVLWRAARRRQL